MPSIAAGKFLPNRMVFFFRQALEDTIGRTAVELIWRSVGSRRKCLSPSGFLGGFPPVKDDLEKAVDFECFASLCASIEQEYGGSGARTILHQAGCVSLSQTLRSTAEMVGLEGPRLHARNDSDRIAEGLTSVARLLELISDMRCSAEALPQGYCFRVTACPECMGRRTGRICYSIGGMLRGALDWLGVDPAVSVTETKCIAEGAVGCEFSLPALFKD